MPKNKFLFIALITIFPFMFISCRTIDTKTYNLETPLLTEDADINIVLVSDLHSTVFGKDQGVLIEKIISHNPDLILLSGDIFDEVSPYLGAELLLKGISSIAPVYYVTGNHEYYTDDMQNIRNMLESYNVRVLSDEYVKINIKNTEIILAGINDPDKKNHEDINYDQNAVMEMAFRDLDEVLLYKILVAHRPENIKIYCGYSFDLAVSGHAHGGQVRLPLINGVYAPNQGLFPKYAGGLYRHGKLTHIVSRGLSIHPWLPRIFNPPELVVIVIKSDL
jgi:predicted MPP superfamily phosphohydrolase